MTSENSTPAEVSTEYEQLVSNIDELIDKLEFKQTSLQRYITDLDVQINQIEMDLTVLEKKKPPNISDIRSRLYSTITKKMELINEFYNTIAQFESVKHRYVQEKNKLTNDKIRLITIELRTLESKLQTNSTDSIYELISEFKKDVAQMANNQQLSIRTHPDLTDPAVSME